MPMLPSHESTKNSHQDASIHMRIPPDDKDNTHILVMIDALSRWAT